MSRQGNNSFFAHFRLWNYFLFHWLLEEHVWRNGGDPNILRLPFKFFGQHRFLSSNIEVPIISNTRLYMNFLFCFMETPGSTICEFNGAKCSSGFLRRHCVHIYFAYDLFVACKLNKSYMTPITSGICVAALLLWVTFNKKSGDFSRVVNLWVCTVTFNTIFSLRGNCKKLANYLWI